MATNIYTHSHFSADEFGDGGCKRTAQIRELLKKYDIDYNLADFDLYNPQKRSLKLYLKGIAYNQSISSKPQQDHHVGKHLQTFKNFVADRKPSSFIWESVLGHNLLLAKVLCENSVPFVALPHNVESLVTGSRSFTSGVTAPDWFPEELKYLRYANKVFTISLEEQWLLSLYGINAGYLPYYPTENVKQYLLSIRAKRTLKQQESAPRKLLLLGTFHNGATLHGYIDLLAHISGIQNIAINVAGFGSEVLNDQGYNNTKIWGTVDKQTLENLLIDSDAVIIHQSPTTGALTRIPELLIAGVPVIANHTASRSYYGFDGINTYQDFAGLERFIKAPLITPAIPGPPVEAENQFIDYFKSLVKV